MTGVMQEIKEKKTEIGIFSQQIEIVKYVITYKGKCSKARTTNEDKEIIYRATHSPWLYSVSTRGCEIQIIQTYKPAEFAT
jgi:hypothetical protein